MGLHRKTESRLQGVILALGTALTCLAWSSWALAQESSNQAATGQQLTGAEILRRSAEGGGLGGPQSVGAQLEEDAAKRTTVSRRPAVDALFQPFEDGLEALKQLYGLQLGTDYQALYQHSNETLLGKEDGSSGSVRVFGKWQLVGRDSEAPGSLVFLFEQRHELWNELTPQQLGEEIGYLGVTGTTFSDSGASLTTLYWEQRFANPNGGFAVGRIDPTDFIDILGYANQRTSFLNLSSLVNPTIALPDPGAGLVAATYLNNQLYVGGVIGDANGSLTEIEFFQNRSEFYKYGEIGWSPSPDQRYLTNIHGSAWQVDERTDAEIPESHGLVLSANVTLNEVLMPFVRAGWSDGEAPFYNRAVSGGLIYYFPRYRDLMGVSVAWNDPAIDDLREQYTLEAFYRYQVSDNIAVTADAQLLLSPSLHPTEDRIAVFGVRARANM